MQNIKKHWRMESSKSVSKKQNRVTKLKNNMATVRLHIYISLSNDQRAKAGVGISKEFLCKNSTGSWKLHTLSVYSHEDGNRKQEIKLSTKICKYFKGSISYLEELMILVGACNTRIGK